MRAGGIHGAILTIDWRNIGPVHLDQETKGIEPVIYLFARDSLRTILIPRALQRRSIDKGSKKEKKGKESSY